jgi:hypothetical protein
VIRKCSSVAKRPAEMALIASPTSIGVLGMTRTTGTPEGKWRSYRAVGNPAQRLTTRVSGLTRVDSSASSGSMSWGLTATTKTCALRAAVAVSTARTW